MPTREENEYIHGVATKHSFTRRDNHNDYHAGHRAYMITLTVEDDKPVFGRVAGSLEAYNPDAPLHTRRTGASGSNSDQSALGPHVEQGGINSNSDQSALGPHVEQGGINSNSEQAALGPHVELSVLGEAVLDAWLAMGRRYQSFITVRDDECVVMPDHFHGLLYVRQNSEKHLSDFERAFKGCCNAAYRLLLSEGKAQPVGTACQWYEEYNKADDATRSAMHEWLIKAYQRSQSYSMGEGEAGKEGEGEAGKEGEKREIEEGEAGKEEGKAGTTANTEAYLSTWSKDTKAATTATPDTKATPVAKGGVEAAPAATHTPATKAKDIGPAPFRVSVQGSKDKVGFLFRPNYNDKHAFSEVTAEEKRRYIRSNPKTRLMRMMHRDWQVVARETVDTDLTLDALHGYLRKECYGHDTPEAVAAIDAVLLSRFSSTRSKNTVRCSCYGNIGLITGRLLLPVVCHRRDKARLDEQKDRLLSLARTEGAVLVSARIAKGEMDIMDAAKKEGLPTVRLLLEGFPDRYHPSQELNELCASGMMALLSCWQWNYRYKEDKIDQQMCKTLNCIVQSICHKKDDFWKQG